MIEDVISIEKTLNSRCSSSYMGTGHARRSHWGIYVDEIPSKQSINHIIDSLKIPRISNGKLIYYFKNGDVFLGYKIPKEARIQKLLQIESGMQQQAIHLACTALGIGTCIKNQGINGTKNEGITVTAKHQIRKMTQPYQSNYFSEKSPGSEKPFIIGKHLSEPIRNGEVECLPNLERLKTSNNSGSSSTETEISQLLWAAKGRSPHLIRLHTLNNLWGLTIPTWGGGQNYTRVYLVRGRKLYRYITWTRDFSIVNRFFMNIVKWTRGNPTHDVEFVRNIHFQNELDGANNAIILTQSEISGRASWEIGYMLENMFLQASGLDIYYKLKIFKSKVISQLSEIGIKKAVAGILL